MFYINYIFLLYIMNNNINYILSLLLILILLLLIVFPLKENFSYKAPYFRSQLYQNVCEPDYGGLLELSEAYETTVLELSKIRVYELVDKKIKNCIFFLGLYFNGYHIHDNRIV